MKVAFGRRLEDGVAQLRTATCVREAGTNVTGRPERAAAQPKRGVKNDHVGTETCEDHLDLAAFPAIRGEPPQCRRQRMFAYRDFWGELRRSSEAALAKSHADIFGHLWEYITRASERCTKASYPLAQQQLPMGLILTGGVNSSEHTDTIADLHAFLTDKGSKVAHLQPQGDGQQDAGLGAVLGSMLSQLRGLPDSGPADIEALQAWHDDAGSDQGEPVVVILQDLESWSPTGLCDLLVLLSDAHASLPLVLLAHISTSPAALQTVLQADATSRVCTEVFRLPSVMTRKERIIEEVLLSGRNTVMLHQATCTAIDNYFQCHDFTTSSLLRGLQVALLSHFMSTPLSMLMPLLSKGEREVHQAISQMAEDSPDLFAYAYCQICPSSKSPVKSNQADQSLKPSMVAAVIEARQAFVGWAVTIRWLAATARTLRSVDPQSFRSGYGIKDLFRLASFPTYFAEGGKGMTSVSCMASQLAALTETEVRPLLELWLAILKDIHGSADQPGLDDLAGEATRILAGEDSTENACPPAGANTDREKGAVALGKTGGTGSSAGSSSHQAHKMKRPPGRTRRAIEEAVASQAARRSASTGSDSGASHSGTQRKTAGAHASALLKEAVSRFLTRHPASLPGSAVFRCRGGMEQQGIELMAAPRETAHRGMQQTEYLAAALGDSDRAAAMEHDTCTAYQLSLLHGEFVNVAEWFTAFAETVMAKGQEGNSSALSVNGGAAAKKLTTRQKRGAHALPTAADNTRGGAATNKRSRSIGKENAAGVLPRNDKELMLQLAARFTQATSELQLLGYIKPARRQRQEVAERLIFPYVCE